MEPIELERSYDRKNTAAKIRRLADALEMGKPFEIKLAGRRIRVPADAEIVFEYEVSDEEEELEVEIKWPRRQTAPGTSGTPQSAE